MTNAITATTPAAAPATTRTLASPSTPPRRRRRYRPYPGPLCLPRWAPVRGDVPELPMRRFKESQQPRGTFTVEEAAACLGISPGRLRAETKSWGLVPFAKGPHGKVVYWAKHVEAIRESRAVKKTARRVEPEKLAA